MKKRLIALLVGTTMLVGLLAACSGGDTGSSAAPASDAASTNTAASTEETAGGGEGFVIGFSNYSVANSWRVQMEAEFVQRAEELKADGTISEYYMTNANDDVTKQVADIRDLMTKGCDAIIVDAISADGLNSVCEEAEEEGIRIISFDDIITSENVTSKIHCDNYVFGQQCGEFLGNALKDMENPKVIVVDGTAGTSTDQERHDGGVDAMMEINPNIEIIATVNCDWDYASAKSAVEGLLVAHPEIDGVLSQGGAMTLGALEAFQAADRDLVPMTGEGNNGFLKAWVEAIPDGFSSIAPASPTYMSSIALDTAIAALRGEEVEAEIVVNVDPITDENAAEYVRDDLSDSFWNLTYLDEDSVQELFGEGSDEAAAAADEDADDASASETASEADGSESAA